ncbi:MAG: TRAP transporter small permease [Firmicutes bacterium]|nr:TRAP transporter small permease [Bacillota bacterium]
MKALLKATSVGLELGVRAVMIIMVSVVTLQIVMRYVVGKPLMWSEELARLSYAWFSYLGVALATSEQSHLRVSFFADKAPARVRRALTLFSQVIILLFCAAVGWQTLQMPRIMGTIRMYSLGVPLWWLLVAIVPGFLASILYTLDQMKRGTPPEGGDR